MQPPRKYPRPVLCPDQNRPPPPFFFLQVPLIESEVDLTGIVNLDGNEGVDREVDLLAIILSRTPEGHDEVMGPIV